MNNKLVESIDKSCRLAELINDPTCNVELKPKELRELLDIMSKMEQLLDWYLPEWEKTIEQSYHFNH